MSASEGKAILEGDFTIERYPGKGGWSYIELPPIPKEEDAPFGWIEASAIIDGVQIEHLKLWPMKKGGVMLSLRADTRKRIKKEAGDSLYLQLFDFDRTGILKMQLIDSIRIIQPDLEGKLQELPSWELNQFLVKMTKAKKEEQKAEIILKIIEELEWR